MFRKRATRLVPLLAAAMLATTASPAIADTTDPLEIGPGQYFVGAVNGETDMAVIRMACFGPVHPGQTGHPMAGQKLQVKRVTAGTRDAGYTGGAAHEIAVDLGGTSTAGRVLVLHRYDEVVEIPTALNLPCYGSGVVTFVPLPGSWTARSATVKVDFVGQP